MRRESASAVPHSRVFLFFYEVVCSLREAGRALHKRDNPMRSPLHSENTILVDKQKELPIMHRFT